MTNPGFTTNITGGTIKVDDGTAASPSLGFASNPTSGWYCSGNTQYLSDAGNNALSVGNGFVTSFLDHTFTKNIWLNSASAATAITAVNTITTLNQSAPVTVTLPAGTNGLMKVIKDASGNAIANNITIVPTGSDKIDNQNSFIINANNGGVAVVFRDGNWNIVYTYKLPTSTTTNTTYNVPGTVLGSTLIFTPLARFTPLMCNVELTNVSALVGAATISIGSNGTSYNNILGLTALASLAGINACVNISIPTPVSVAANTGIYVRVTTAALATTFNFKVTLIGTYT